MTYGTATIERTTSHEPQQVATPQSWQTWIHGSAEPVTSTAGERVLLIAYQFPPTGGSGVYRPAGLSRWLPTFGWDTEILTAGHQRFPWIDDTLMVLVPEACNVHRVRGLEPASLAEQFTFTPSYEGKDARSVVPDDLSERSRQGGRLRRYIQDRIHWRLLNLTERMGLANGERLWIRSAVRHAVRCHRRKPFDAVISTGPPHVAHHVARQLARKLGVRWLADVRDPMVSDFDRNVSDSPHSQQMKQLETIVLNEADEVITTCPSLAAYWQSRYPHRSENIHSITNGFHREQIATVAPCVEQRRTEICRFVAAGAFYGKREIAGLIEPLEEVLRWRPDWKKRVQLTIAGTIDGEQQRQWAHHLPSWVELVGYVDRHKALELTATASCNILMVPDCEHGRLSIPGKTFDLLALPQHVLALAPSDSDTARIVSSVSGTTCTPLESSAHIAAAMQRIVGDCLSGQLETSRDWRQLDQYDQRYMARQFATCLARGTKDETAVAPK